MKVLRVGFVGTRTASVKATTSFFRDVLDLQVLRDDSAWSILQLPTGRHEFLEVYGETFDDERLAPSGTGLFVGFVVDDLEGAHEEVLQAGAEASDILWAAEVFGEPSTEGFGWFFVKAPDGNTYVIQQVPG